MSFEEWLEKYAESGIHLRGLSPKEYGQAIWAHMSAVNDNLEKQLKEAESFIEKVKNISNYDLYNNEIVEQIDLALIEYFKNKEKI